MAKLPTNDEVNIRASAQALKQYFLENASPLVKQYIDAALGDAEFTSHSSSAREEVWEVLKSLMLQSSDKLEIDIETADDILTAVSQGKCTFEEGEKLLNLYKKLKEVNEVSLIPGASGPAGLTINILSAPTPKPVIDATASHIIPNLKEGESIVVEVPDEATY